MVLKATMVVINDFKGVAKKDTIVVYTGIRGATCGFKFEPNKEYTVYGTNENYLYMFLRLDRKRFRNFSKKGVYWTSICSRTTIAVGREQGLLNEHFCRKMNKSRREFLFKSMLASTAMSLASFGSHASPKGDRPGKKSINIFSKIFTGSTTTGWPA